MMFHDMISRLNICKNVLPEIINYSKQQMIFDWIDLLIDPWSALLINVITLISKTWNSLKTDEHYLFTFCYSLYFQLIAYWTYHGILFLLKMRRKNRSIKISIQACIQWKNIKTILQWLFLILYVKISMYSP